jgi:hypothetical protein
MTLGLEICAVQQVKVKEITTISLEEETREALALLFGRLHARIESGMTKIKTFIKGADWLCRYQLRRQIGYADINLI